MNHELLLFTFSTVSPNYRLHTHRQYKGSPPGQPAQRIRKGFVQSREIECGPQVGGENVSGEDNLPSPLVGPFDEWR